jgi:hypothetical protein
MPTEIQSCLVSLLQDLLTILDTVQWTSLFHRIIPSCWFGQTSLAITWSVVGCRLLTVLSNILPWPSSAPPSGAGNHHSFLPELQVLGLPPVAVAAKLECQPIQWQSSSSPTPRDFNLLSLPDPRQTAAALGTLTRARVLYIRPKDGSRSI